MKLWIVYKRVRNPIARCMRCKSYHVVMKYTANVYACTQLITLEEMSGHCIYYMDIYRNVSSYDDHKSLLTFFNH